MDLCVSQNVGCDDQRFWGIFILAVFTLFALLQIGWAYWSAHRERQKMRRTPMAIRRIPIADEVSGESYPGQRQLARFRSQAYPVKKTDRWPLRGLDRLLNSFFRGGSISGF